MTSLEILACFRKYACHLADMEGSSFAAQIATDRYAYDKSEEYTEKELQFMKEHVLPEVMRK